MSVDCGTKVGRSWKSTPGVDFIRYKVGFIRSGTFTTLLFKDTEIR